uniref:Microtubule-associated protein n=1 Tax=Naja naja TaxID=35670 RepID=A0A8C6XCK4_NAJNA
MEINQCLFLLCCAAVKTEVKAAEVKKMPAKASTGNHPLHSVSPVSSFLRGTLPSSLPSSSASLLIAESSRPKSAPVSTTASPAPLGAAASRPKVKPMASKLPGTSGVTPEAKKPSLASKALPKTSLGSKSPRPSTSVSVPDLKNIRSKIGSTDNIKYQPGGGKVQILSKKANYSHVQSKCGSKDNIKHVPGGGNVQIQNKKIDLSKVSSKCGSKTNIKHKPGGGDVKIENQKLNFKEKAQAKVGSLDNVGHVPAGGTVKIQSHKLTFRENAKARTDHGADFAACTGSPSASPPLSTSVSETLGTITAAAMSSLPPRLPWQAPLAEETSAALSRPGL